MEEGGFPGVGEMLGTCEEDVDKEGAVGDTREAEYMDVREMEPREMGRVEDEVGREEEGPGGTGAAGEVSVANATAAFSRTRVLTRGGR